MPEDPPFLFCDDSVSAFLAGLTNDDQKLVLQAIVGGAANPDRTPYPNDVAAAGGGVPLGGFYLTNGFMKYRQVTPVLQVAFVGDSNTANGVQGTGSGGVGPYQLTSLSYITYVYAMLGSQFDFAPNGSNLVFAQGGLRTDEIYAAYQAGVLASIAALVFDMAGTNDAVQTGIDLDVAAANRLAFWLACRTAGKWVIALSIYPIGAGQSGNAGPGYALSARAVLFNTKCKALADAHGFPWVDVTSALELTPGTGIANPAYLQAGDFLHTNGLGSCHVGRVVAAVTKADPDFVCSVNNRTAINFLTAGANFAGGPPPTHWSLFSPSGGSQVGSGAIIADPDGAWWEITVAAGTSTASFQLNNFDLLGGNPTGKTIDSIIEVQVMSGTMTLLNLQQGVQDASTTAQVFQTNETANCDFTSSDGVLVLRTTPLVAGTTTFVYPFIQFRVAGTTTLRFRRSGTRQLN